MFSGTPLTRCPLVFDTLVTLLLFVLAAGLGRRLLRWLRLSLPDPLEHSLFATALGLGTLSFLPFLLFALGIGQAPVVVGLTLLLALLLLPEEAPCVRGALRGLALGARSLIGSGPNWAWVLAAALLPLLMVTFLKALCPPTDPDGLHYHLTAPLQYLAHGGFFFMPTFLHVHWPLGEEMLFGIGMAFNRHYPAGMVQFGIGLLLLLATYALGKRLANPVVGALAASLLLFWTRSEMSWAYIDLGLAFYTLTAFFAFFLGWERAQAANIPNAEPRIQNEAWIEAGRWWRLSALLAGLTATTKLPGILNVGLLAVMVFLTLWNTQRLRPAEGAASRGTFALRTALGYLALGALVAAPWYLRAWALTHDPFYPYFAGLFGARDWSADAQKRMTEYFQVFNTLRSRHLSTAAVVKVRAALCLALAVMGVLFCSWRATRPARPLFAFLFAAAFLQVATSGIYIRFFLPALPFVTLALFWLLRDLLARSEAARWAGAILVALTLWGLHHLPSAVRGAAQEAKAALPAALGIEPRDTYLTRQLPIYPMLQWSNTHLPPDSGVVLGVLDAYAALLEHRPLFSSLWTQDALRFTDYATTVSDLRRLRATHLLLFPHPPPTPEEKAGLDKEARVRSEEEYPKLERVAQEYGKPIYQNNGYVLYELHLPE